MNARTNILIATALLAVPATSQDAEFLQDSVFSVPKWRTVGPVNFGGRIVDIEVDPTDRYTWYAVSATGGIHKTENNGTTFRTLFTDEAAFSLGDLAIAPSDPDVLYIGTGEANNQRSSYLGNGVYKSTNGGRKWEHVGLDGTDHIGRIVVHPTDPDVAWVAALGALYKPNAERGLYRTKDGGESWENVKFIDEDTGFVDLVVDPKDPDHLIAASYERRRRAWDFNGAGTGSAIWRSTDGGDSWKKMREGLPSGQIGRIGLAMSPRNPNTVYALVENANPAPPRRAERPARGDGDPRDPRDGAVDPGFGFEHDPELYPLGEAEHETAVAPAPAARPIGGEVYRSDDGGESWEKVSEKAVAGTPHYYYGQLRIDPNDDQRLWAVGVRISTSDDGGRTWKTGFGRGLHVDHHALWIDPNDSRRALLGNDGGLGETWDDGKSWRFIDDLPIAQFYAVGVDNRDPYVIYGGTQDNGSWGVPSRSRTNARLGKSDAFKIGGGDGFYVVVDPTDPDIIYSESQFGAISRMNLATNSRRSIRPSARRGSPRLRFNWMAPILISPHDNRTVYFGSQFLHRSHNRGDDWEVVSADLSTADETKIAGNVPHCTITTIAESPLERGQLWAGTDDGNVWLSRDGGGRWIDLTDRFPDVPEKLWVSRIEASAHDEDRAFVTFTGYREDLREPYLYLTEDGGETFRSISNNLPKSPINVVREHPRNDWVLFVGTEFGVQVSADAGATWFELGDGLPTVAVHDLVVHPRESDVVVATHGYGFWVLDATAFEDLSPDTLRSSFAVFDVRDGRRTSRVFPTVRYPAALGWSAPQAQNRAVFRYWLREDSEDEVLLRVLDATGKELFSRRGDTDAGLHEVTWGGGARRTTGRRGGAAGARGRQAAGAPARDGDYVLEVTRGDTTERRRFRVSGA